MLEGTRRETGQDVIPVRRRVLQQRDLVRIVEHEAETDELTRYVAMSGWARHHHSYRGICRTLSMFPPAHGAHDMADCFRPLLERFDLEAVSTSDRV